MDGLVIEAVGQRGPDPQLLAAELAGLMRAMGGVSRALGEELRRFTVATDEHEILAVCFGQYCLGALIQRGSDRKAVGAELSRLALVLAERL